MMIMKDEIPGSYLDLMDQQREQAFQALKHLDEAKIWQRPISNDWCIGEILDHTRAINSSFLPLIRATWFFGKSLAGLNRHKPYAVEIDDVYHRPNFPMNVGWMWPPKYTPRHPAPQKILCQSLLEVHQKYRQFYEGKDPDLLGHISVFDPVIGRVNLIQVLRVAIYHDQLHFQDVIEMAADLRLHTTPVA